jgi:hypothetical protein
MKDLFLGKLELKKTGIFEIIRRKNYENIPEENYVYLESTEIRKTYYKEKEELKTRMVNMAKRPESSIIRAEGRKKKSNIMQMRSSRHH